MKAAGARVAASGRLCDDASMTTSKTAAADQAATQDDPAAALRRHLEEKTALIGIVGLGYVGLPLARATTCCSSATTWTAGRSKR